MQDLFTNTFPLDGKIKPSVAGVSENGRKKNEFPPARIRSIFKKRFPLISVTVSVSK